MADLIKLKRSAVQGKIPEVADLELGELGLNTYDGKIYLKKNDGVEAVVEVSGSVEELNDISNVNAVPTDGQSLTWNDIASEWQASTISTSGDTSIDGGTAGSVYTAPQLIDGGTA